MRTVNVLAIVGVGFLAVGAMFCVTDLMLFDNSYVLLMGPIVWIVGCALMVAWAVIVALSKDREARGAAAVLTKPTHTPELLAVVDRLLQDPRPPQASKTRTKAA